MGSGDHGVPLRPGAVAGPRVPPLIGSAETVASVSPPASVAPPAPRAEIAPASRAPSASRRPGWIVGGLVGLAGIAIGAVLVMRADRAPEATPTPPVSTVAAVTPTPPSPPAAPPTAPPADPGGAVDAVAVDAGAVDAVAVAAGVVAPVALATDAAVPPPTTEVPRPDAGQRPGTKPRPPEPAPTANELGKLARDAEAAFKRRDYAEARRLASAMINDPEQRPRLQAHGFALRAMLFCVGTPDEDRALAAFRQLGPRHPMRARVLAFCRARNFLLSAG